MKYIKLFEAFLDKDGNLSDFEFHKEPQGTYLDADGELINHDAPDKGDMEEMYDEHLRDHTLLGYTIPTWAVAPLVNGDNSALSDEEDEMIAEFLDEVVAHCGNGHFIVNHEDEYELGFLSHNDVEGNVGGDCVRLFIKPTN